MALQSGSSSTINPTSTQTNRCGITRNEIRKAAGLVKETLAARSMEERRALVKEKK
jgi:hypothetical protein